MELFEQLRQEHEFGVGTIAGVAAKFGVHRRMVRQAIAGALPPVHRYPARVKPELEAIAAFIDQVLAEDRRAPRKQRHTARRIYRRILTEFPDACVAEWTVRNHVRDRKRAMGLIQRETRVPSARTVARLMTMARDSLSRTQTVMVATIETAIPTLVQARDLVDRFQTLIRRKQEAAVDDWLTMAAVSLLASFARGLARDHLAVRAAISSAWSNAQAEGQINKLKVVKRQMYGRGKLDLLQARVIAAGC